MLQDACLSNADDKYLPSLDTLQVVSHSQFYFILYFRKIVIAPEQVQILLTFGGCLASHYPLSLQIVAGRHFWWLLLLLAIAFFL